MVGPDQERLLCSPQPVAALLQGNLHHQELLVVDVIVLLGGCPGQVGAGVLSMISGTALLQCPDPSTSTVNWSLGSGMVSTGAEVNFSFKVLKVASAASFDRKWV